MSTLKRSTLHHPRRAAPIFKCDRAWLLYPCDPEAGSFGVPAERTSARSTLAPSAPTLTSRKNAARGRRRLPAACWPWKVRCASIPSYCALPSELAKWFNIKSIIAMAPHPEGRQALRVRAAPVLSPTSSGRRTRSGCSMRSDGGWPMRWTRCCSFVTCAKASESSRPAGQAHRLAGADRHSRRRDAAPGSSGTCTMECNSGSSRSCSDQRRAATIVPPKPCELQAQLSGVVDGLGGRAGGVAGDLAAAYTRPSSPPAAPVFALKALARVSAVPVEVEVRVERGWSRVGGTGSPIPSRQKCSRIPRKHARASTVHVCRRSTRRKSPGFSIRDDGCGGANPARGSGLIGLTDRVDALRGDDPNDKPHRSGNERC